MMKEVKYCEESTFEAKSRNPPIIEYTMGFKLNEEMQI